MSRSEKKSAVNDRLEEKTGKSQNPHPWINPVGGLGDMLMVAGVLKQLNDRDPNRKFNVLRRTRYTEVFRGHPAIAKIGHPPPDTEIVHTTYWQMEKLGGGKKRAYQVLARYFGIETPAEEFLYLPDIPDEDHFLDAIVPWKKINIMIAPASESPRKTMPFAVWHELTDKLLADGFFVAQAGLAHEIHIKNSYSLLGLTNPRQLVRMISKFDLIVTADNFIMHAAHMKGKSALVIWGPTQKEVYGYPEHEHIQRFPQCGLKPGQSCLVPDKDESGKMYGTPCPLGPDHCMAHISADEIYRACRKVLAGVYPRNSGSSPRPTGDAIVHTKGL